MIKIWIRLYYVSRLDPLHKPDRIADGEVRIRRINSVPDAIRAANRDVALFPFPPGLLNRRTGFGETERLTFAPWRALLRDHDRN